MVKQSLEIITQVCNRCNHQWIPRVSLKELISGDYEDSTLCPGCKSPYWNKERKNKINNK